MEKAMLSRINLQRLDTQECLARLERNPNKYAENSFLKPIEQHAPVYYMIYITMIGKQMTSVLLKGIMR